MSIRLTETQLEDITRVVREVTTGALPDATKELVKQLVLTGHCANDISKEFAERGASQVVCNGVRWLAEDLEANLLFSVVEERK